MPDDKNVKKVPVLLSLFVALALQVDAQRTLSVKNNLLYDATLTPNLGVEVAVGERSSLQLFYGLNPWHGYHGLKRLQHWSLMPEYRYWLSGQQFRGWFTGLHAVGGEYNVGGVKLPFGLFKPLRYNHYEGWYAGGGLTLGHAWQLSDHWNLEAALGLGYIYTHYDRYENRECGLLLESGPYHYFGPTKLALNLAYVFGEEPHVVAPPPVVPEPLPIHQPDYTLSYERPKAELEKARELSGQAFLDFVVNKTDIRRDYRRNAVELAKVDQTINEVRQDPNITINHISIHGYASPEGSFQNNTRLAEGRAQAFKDYVQTLISLPASIFSVASTPEDWQGLISYLENQEPSTPPYDNLPALLAIARSDAAPDQKERQLKRDYPTQWRQLLAEVFPALRHSDYRVSYTIRPFTVEEARELIRTKPQQLSLNEMFLVANTYTPGSLEYDEVFDIAVRMYPADETANLNAAITALRKGDLDAADRYLLKAGQNPTALTARGVLAARRNDFTTARQLFQQADTDAARHNLQELNLYLQSLGQ